MEVAITLPKITQPKLPIPVIYSVQPTAAILKCVRTDGGEPREKPLHLKTENFASKGN
jgi:hypothetical protein